MVLLIGGHGRSGTTLLRHLCHSHREMAVTNEMNFLSGLGRGYAENCLILLKRVGSRTLNGIAFGHGMRPGMDGGIFAASYLRALPRNSAGIVDVASVEQALRAVFPRARLAGDKTPHYIFLLDRVAGMQGLACVIIYRDCRDVVSSMLQKVRTLWRKRSWSRRFDSAEKVTLMWVESVELMERHWDRIYTIRYEDLVLQPRAELVRLASWLGVDPGGFPPSRLDSVQATSIGKYRTGLTREELATVMTIAGPTMRRLGYT